MMHRCHGMRRSRFSRDSTAAAACSTVRFRPWGALTASQVHKMYPCHPRPLCDHRRPCWQRSGRSCIAHPEPLPLGPATAANAPLPGMLQRAWPCALRCHHRSAHLHHRRAFRALGHSPCLRPAEQELSGVARKPPRGCAAQVHQLALVWRPGKSA